MRSGGLHRKTVRPNSFGVLTSEEKRSYFQIEKNIDISKVPSRGFTTRGQKFLSVLESEEYSMTFKAFITLRHYDISVVNNWGFKNLEGSNLILLCQIGHYTEEAALSFAQNVNLTWDVAKKFVFDVGNSLTYPGYRGMKYHNIFLDNLNETVFTEDFALKFIDFYLASSGYYVDERIVMHKLRKVFGVDESVPDAWLIQMLKSLTTEV